MRKLISFIHISLDGFVGGPNGEMDWIKIDDELFRHIEKRISTGDSAVYGRNTFQMMESYWPTAADKPNATKHDIEHSKWYATIQKIVLSKSMQGQSLLRTTIISDNIVENINAIKQGEGGDILIFGSPSTTKTLMQFGLIDGYWLFVNPVILGKGIALFDEVHHKEKLKLLSTKSFSSGVVELNYNTER